MTEVPLAMVRRWAEIGNPLLQFIVQEVAEALHVNIHYFIFEDLFCALMQKERYTRDTILPSSSD
ncbi:hypothetical protein D2Q93_15980 [Alicyclobacillaceae bacterium I2511]|nr:hypothetical protein D2Q93_15980 [Alicyclobacillaceae bacterium I2511]